MPEEWPQEIKLCDSTVSVAIELYQKMQLIRQVQYKIESIYHLDEMKTPVHLYIGQEAIAAGVSQALAKTDYVFSNHRGHGHYLAKGGNLRTMIAELFCRSTGCAKGRGGSMHLIDKDAGLAGASSIVAGGIPIAVGAALNSHLQNDGKISVVYFGDGAADEGVLYESVNFAVLHKLPVIFVCENNFYAVCSPVTSRQTDTGSIAQRFTGMSLPVQRLDGANAMHVYEAAKAAASLARAGEGPSFIECLAYRWRGHSGAGADTALGYRADQELQYWVDRCPLARLKAAILKTQPTCRSLLDEADKKIIVDIDNTFADVMQDPLPDGGDVCSKLCIAGGR